VTGVEVSRVTVHAAYRAMVEGERGFIVLSDRGEPPQIVVDIVPVERCSGRPLFWLVFRDDIMRLMDGEAIIHHVARMSSAA
jgi:hypothetical protein